MLFYILRFAWGWGIRLPTHVLYRARSVPKPSEAPFCAPPANMTHRPHLPLSACTTLYISSARRNGRAKERRAGIPPPSITRRLHRAVRYAAHSSATLSLASSQKKARNNSGMPSDSYEEKLRPHSRQASSTYVALISMYVVFRICVRSR